ncbi:MAG TPA: glycosyltransferase family 39 protein [Candidatus Saccharimonadales bacterium]|nr:glycosyltransferase family 39 protein [Candidatus Saccharimonadales bacterium]
MSFLDKMTLFYNNKFHMVILILLVTSFIHLWNPTGFPNVHVDEGTYMFRAMHLLSTGNIDWNASFYDHPYFGPILLAGMLYVINFPAIITSEIQNDSPIYSSYFIPRIIIGIFAILDTILIYAITKIRYGRNAAIISALLFSVMPFTWGLRRIYLESLLYPLLLSSILIVLYLNSCKSLKPKKISRLLILFSGVLLGLAIFTKAPAVTMIPLLAFYSYKYNRKIIHVVLFLVPVIIVPFLWPFDAMLKGEFQQWVLGLTSQIDRQNDSIVDSLYDIFLIDPIILSLGLIGTAFAIIKRDFFIVFGIIPFIAFFSFFISYLNWFYFIPIFGFLCISSGVLLEWIIKHLQRYGVATVLIPSIVIALGILSTYVLISTDIASFQFVAMSYINTILEKDSKNHTVIENNSGAQSSKYNELIQDNDFQKEAKHIEGSENSKSIVIIASPIYSWIYKFVYLYEDTFYSYTDNTEIKNGSKIILVLDRYFRDYLANNLESRNKSWNENLGTSDKLYKVIGELNSSKYFTGTSRNFDFYQYPYTSMRFNLGGSPIEIRSN